MLGKLVLLLIVVLSVRAMNKMPPPEAKLYPGFSRHCPTGDTDCKFTSPESPDNSLYFRCRENVCFCSRGRAVPPHELVWPVQWNQETCLVGNGGSCGDDQGLTVQCAAGFNCIQGRCRKSNELNNGKLLESCNDDIDCQSGLSCRPPSDKMEIRIKRCMRI